MSSSEFLFPKINPLKNKEYALYLLLSPTQNSQSSSYYPNQLLSLSLFSYKVIFKLLSSKPGDIIDSIPTRERARVLAHRHTHTHTPPVSNQIILDWLPTHSPSYCLCPINRYPSTPPQALNTHLISQHKVRRAEGSLDPSGKLSKDKSRHCTLGNPGTIIRGSDPWKYQESLKKHNLS